MRELTEELDPNPGPSVHVSEHAPLMSDIRGELEAMSVPPSDLERRKAQKGKGRGGRRGGRRGKEGTAPSHLPSREGGIPTWPPGEPRTCSLGLPSTATAPGHGLPRPQHRFVERADGTSTAPDDSPLFMNTGRYQRAIAHRRTEAASARLLQGTYSEPPRRHLAAVFFTQGGRTETF